MNYNNQILQNKWFNLIKLLMCDLGIVLSIVLCGLLILIYCFGFNVCEVMSNSQSPVINCGDLVVTKPAKNYNVGDIVMFNAGALVTHRLIAISKDGKTYYFHGDNEVSVIPDNYLIINWKENSAYLQGLINSGIELTELNTNKSSYQVIAKHKVEGKVVLHVAKFGMFISFLKNHLMLSIVIILCVWGVFSVVEHELNHKQFKRLL